jgi:tryptophan synthase alpha chain
MNRIIETFEKLKREGSKAIIGYITAGYPDMIRSEEIINEALSSGIDILELGVPFSDPTADGPVIQSTSHKALQAGCKLSTILKMATRIRRKYDNPIVLFSYANPLYAYGLPRLCRDLAKAGLDGVLAVDIPFEESGELRKELKKNDLVLIQLIAPTTSYERAKAILKEADGFIYYIMVKGITGIRKHIATDLETHIKQIKKCTSLPVAVGFGISKAEQAKAAAKFADAVVVGSALMQAIDRGKVASFIRSLVKVLHKAKK